MDYDQYIIKMKELQNNLLKFIEEDESNGDSIFLKYLNENKISKSRLDLYHLIRLLLQIVNDFHRYPSFLDKIKQVFNYLKNDIKNIFTNIEIFNICKSSKLVLLYFIKNDFLNLDDFIIKEMNKTFTSKSKIYFYPEIKNEFRNYNKKFQEEYSFIIKDPNFDEKRELGENDSYICSLIRQDLIDEFIIYVNRTNLSLSSVINSSVFETNSFLQNKNISLIEYAAFFGSFQIFKYLQLNNVILSHSLILYAIHGKNAEIIHILEENVDDISYIDCFFKAIKCHHNDIAIYFLNTHLNREKSSFFALEFHNYEFFPENLQNINFSKFLEYVFKYDLVKIVDILINSKIIDVNKTLISMWYLLREAFDKKSYEIVNLLLLQPELEIGYMFFVNHKNLEKITYNSNSFSLSTLNFKTHISTIRIGIEAFARCRFLTEVCLPSSVTIIEKNAFSESSIQSISILSNYIELKKGWCSNTPKLKKIYMNPDNKNYKFYDNKFILGKSSIESEKYDVIEFCLRNIENATIPNFIQLIEQYAFQFCINIQEIEFPKSLIKIEKYAFDNCKQLKKISIPSFVYSIGEYSFSKCSKLEQVTFPVARFYYNDNIFKKYSSLEKISITLSLFNIGEGAFEDCSSLKQIEIPSSITSIQDRVFHNCTSLMNVKIPSTLTSIGSLAFEKCINLTQINFPQSLKEIEYQAFKDCDKLNDLPIPSYIEIYKSNKLSYKLYYKSKLINKKNVETIGKLNTIDLGLINVCVVECFDIDYYLYNYLIYDMIRRDDNRQIKVKLCDAFHYYHCINYDFIRKYFDGASGIMLLFDLSFPESLEFALYLYKSFIKKIKKEFICILVGIKFHLESNISYEKANKTASDNNLLYFEVSDLKNKGINEAISFIVASILEFKPYFA